MAEEDNLDVLCDLLEDSDDEKDETIGSQLDDSFDEQIFNLNDKEVAKIEAVKKPDNNSNSKKKIKIISRAPSVVPSSSSALGTIHILRRHFYSTKLNLTSKVFTKTEFFSSNWVPIIRTV